MDIRRIKVGNKRYRLQPLTREQKIILSKHNLMVDDWLFISESDSYVRVVKKSSLQNDLIIKTLYK